MPRLGIDFQLLKQTLFVLRVFAVPIISPNNDQKMKETFGILSIVFTLIPLFSAGQDYRARIDAYLQREWEAGVAPGFAALVVRGEDIIFAKGYGPEVIGQNRPMTIHTVSGIASITKSLTAFAVMKLVEEGRIDLDAPVTDYLPWFRTANRGQSDRITVRMLLNNTAGLPSHHDLNSDDFTDRALEENIRALAGVYLDRAPGKSYEYSNQGFAVAGLAAARAVGMTYRELMEQKVFEPMNMHHTSLDPAQFDALGAISGHAPGADGPIPAGSASLSGSYIPAGSVTRSTASDMGNYLITLLNEGRFHGKQVIAAESLRAMFSPQVAFPGLSYEQGGAGKRLHYGLGLMTGEVDGRHYILHGGSAGTMSALLVLEPATKTGAVILFNYDLTFIDTYQHSAEITILNNVIRLATGAEISDFGKPRVEDPTKNNYQLPGILQSRYTGHYDLNGRADPFLLRGADLEIRTGKNGDLEAVFVRSGKPVYSARLDFVHEALALTRNGNKPVQLQFRVQPDGTVTELFLDGVIKTAYRKRPEGFLADFRRISHPAAGVTVYLPASWSAVSTAQGIAATSEDMTIHILPYQAIGGDKEQATTIATEYLSDYTIIRTGRMQTVEWKGHRWHQLCLDLRKGDKPCQCCLLWTSGRGKELLVVLRTPGGRLTGAIQEVVIPMMQTME